MKLIRGSGISFRFVKTQDNPADIGFRGCLPEELHKNLLRWESPQWLAKQENDWPDDIKGEQEEVIPEEEEQLPPKQPNTILIVSTGQVDELIDATNYSSLHKLLTVVSKIFLFAIKTRKQLHPDRQALKQKALSILIKQAQHVVTLTEITK